MEDHSGHNMPDHSGHNMPGMCKTNMIFNWQIEDTCVVFEWWHIKGPFTFIISCVGVALIAAFYEWLRAYSNCIEYKWKEAAFLAAAARDEQEEQHEERTALFYHHQLSRKREGIKSIYYAILVAISFWLMLVFMTYNGYLMMAVVLGAGLGHFFFGNGWLSASRSIQCH
ncbi:Ctr copper transporter [Backusella circina FSU 941]|nr:Ctr copper transporter [Backusella circina FSU 941]